MMGEMDEIQASFKLLCFELGIELSARQLQQFDSYYELLVSWNEKINLTAITERSQVYVKHFYDSLTLQSFVDLNEVSTFVDVGSGAGFPGIPLKIAFPHLQLTMIDSLNKRILFLSELSQQLRLKDVRCWHGRAEDAGRLSDFRDHFDMASARAVAKLSILNELCLPLVKPGGLFIAMKGSQVEEEIDDATHSLQQLNASIERSTSISLPNSEGERTILFIKKKGRTPAKFPRKAGLPNKSPL